MPSYAPYFNGDLERRRYVLLIIDNPFPPAASTCLFHDM